MCASWRRLSTESAGDGEKTAAVYRSSSQHDQPVAVCSECCGLPGVFFPVCRHLFNNCIGWRWSSGLSTSLLYLFITVPMVWHHHTSPMNCSLFQLSWHTAMTAISNHQRPCGSADLSFHHRWSGFPCCRSSGVEQPASLSDISSNAQHIQAAAENRTFHSLLRSAVFLCTQTFCIILSCCTACYTFLLVQCPSSLWTQCHYSKFCLIIIIIINSVIVLQEDPEYCLLWVCLTYKKDACISTFMCLLY